MPLPLSSLISVALKSLFLEAAWNAAGQQNLGFAAAIDSALVKIYYDNPEKLEESRVRAGRFFNTHPVMSGPALGVALNLEEQLRSGRLDEARYLRLTSSLTSALAAVGDAFFWGAYLPLCVAVSLWVMLALDCPWSALLIPAIFSLLHLPIRFGGFFLGYKRGLALFQLLDKLRLLRWAVILKKGGAVILGSLTALMLSRADWGPSPLGALKLWAASLGALALVLSFVFLIRYAGRLEIWLYCILFLAALSGIVFS